MTSTSATHVPIVIIGCGFGGMALAIELKNAGMNDFVILERAGEIGGVWRDNCYPGAACDVVSRLYSFSYDQDYEWSAPFAPQKEILTYAKMVANRHGIVPHVRFNTEVRNATFDEATGNWTVETAGGERLTTPVLVSAVGLFNNPNIPDIPGRDTFKGVQFHSARWNHDFDLRGKTVAVVGNGASGVQFIPKIAEVVDKLYLFQRTPQYVLPKSIFPGTGKFDAWLQKHRNLRWLARLKIYLMFERFIFRRRFRPALRLKAEEGYRKMLEAKVKDPVLRKKLTPNYPIGCKRQLVSDVWLDTMTRPNLELIDTPIERIDADGLVSEGVHRKVDAIIYGTGFTPTAYLTPMKIRGLAGRDLNDAWRKGAEAYLGITVTGFPNFFMLYGPNTNAISSIIFMLECQARYIVSAIRTLQRKRARFMNVRPDVQKQFNAEQQEILSQTIQARPDCFTYYKDENGKITTNWPTYATVYLWRTRAVKPGDYEFAPA
ncbi:MAG TPA: NAD(P)/FAD-dependent oxidoreductase [Xanthobacteraceae bacterium]|nr:NAD(P)/FAD-dependent oxidoreductase [Xanthobacteraceae bacterium]